MQYFNILFIYFVLCKITLTRKQIQCIVYFYREEHNTCTVYVKLCNKKEECRNGAVMFKEGC